MKVLSKIIGSSGLSLVFILMFSASLTLSSGCAPKSGCKATEDLGPQTDKDGQLSKKRGKTKLFDN